MAKDNVTPPPVTSEFVGDYELDNCGRVSIKRKNASDYASMRAAQLAALLQITYGGGGESFRNYSDSIQDDVLWLAAGLAEELKKLIPLIDADRFEMSSGRQS